MGQNSSTKMWKSLCQSSQMRNCRSCCHVNLPKAYHMHLHLGYGTIIGNNIATNSLLLFNFLMTTTQPHQTGQSKIEIALVWKTIRVLWMIKPVCLVARLQWIKHAHSSNSFSAEGPFSLSHIIVITSHCVPTLGKDLKQDSQNIWNQFFVCLGGKEKLGGLALPVLIKAEIQHSDTFSRKICSRQHFLNKVLSVKWSRVYFNIIYLGIQVVWVYYPRTCQDVLTKKINSEPFKLKKKK